MKGCHQIHEDKCFSFHLGVTLDLPSAQQLQKVPVGSERLLEVF